MSSTMETSASAAGQLFKAEPAPSADSEYGPQCDYCRLCATQFPTPELQNFSASNEESNRLLIAVRRMNSSIHRGDELPQTACKECIRLLEAVEVIVKKIANAQSTLTDIFKRVLASKVIEIKMEITKGSDSENGNSSDSERNKKRKQAPNAKKESSNSDSFIDDSESETTSDSLTTDTEEEYKKKKKTAKSKKQIKPQNISKVQRKRRVKNTVALPLSNAAVEFAEMNIETASHSSKLSMLPIYNNVPTTTINNEAPVKCEDPTLPRWSDFFCCRRCNHRAQSLQDLREHSWSTHKLCIVFKCVICPGRVNNINYKYFFRHMILKHHSALEQCCEFCNQCFVSSSEVRFHKELEHSNEAKPHKCKSCGSTFDLAEELQSHRDSFIIVKAKQAGDRRFKCTVCDKEFLNKITLESHIDEHDPTKNICSICNKKFKDKYHLKYHVDAVHNKIVRMHICQICGQGFRKEYSLKVHISRHTGILNYSCETCEKKFANKNSLKEHQVTHSDARPHVCSVCGKSYKFLSGLKLHMQMHLGIKPYSCDVCGKAFNAWGNFNKHMKRIHRQDMSKRKAFNNFNISDIPTLNIT